MEYIFIVGLIAGTIGGIVGTSTSIMLVPVLIYAFGPGEAVTSKPPGTIEWE